MAYTTVNNGSLFMDAKLYTGNSSARTISGVGFQPDFTWLKVRDGATAHFLFDVLRGPLYRIQSNSSNTSVSAANTLTSWNSDGFALGTENDTNNNSYSYVSWNWKANGTGSANTAGSINSTVSASTTSGFSIVKYQGTGANATVGHGLGSVPKMILFKSLANSISWIVYSSELNVSSSNCLRLNGTNAAFTESAWNGTRPTTSVFSLGPHNEANNSSGETIAYCFADVQGFSKMGSYVGNENVNGTFVYTGFKPAFVMIKNTSTTTSWSILDNKRSVFNPADEYLKANTSDAVSDLGDVDILSNGLKMRTTNNHVNGPGNTYIYMAFAENPFVATSGSTAVPVTAR